MVDKIGRNLGQLSVTGLWTFGEPYEMSGLGPHGNIFPYIFSVILPSSLRRFIMLMTFFSLWVTESSN